MLVVVIIGGSCHLLKKQKEQIDYLSIKIENSDKKETNQPINKNKEENESNNEI